MNNGISKSSVDNGKKYGGTSVFFGSLLLIDLALIAYNLNYMKYFKEINYTYYAIPSDASVFEKLADRYFSFFAKFLGYYPSTKVLSIAFPLAFVFLIWFIDDFSKYLKQNSREKAERAFLEIKDDEIKNTEIKPDDKPEEKPEDKSEDDNLPQ